MSEKGTKREKTILGLFFGPWTRQSSLLPAGGTCFIFPNFSKKGILDIPVGGVEKDLPSDG